MCVHKNVLVFSVVHAAAPWRKLLNRLKTSTDFFAWCGGYTYKQLNNTPSHQHWETLLRPCRSWFSVLWPQFKYKHGSYIDCLLHHKPRKLKLLKNFPSQKTVTLWSKFEESMNINGIMILSWCKQTTEIIKTPFGVWFNGGICGNIMVLLAYIVMEKVCPW